MDNSLIYLVQTDTTVGFLSKNPISLSGAKKRDPKKKILEAVDSFRTLQSLQRVPNKFKKFVRNASKTTFIYPNQKAFRVVTQKNHLYFLKKFHSLYSTSANETGKNFDFSYAFQKCDAVLFSKEELHQSAGSMILKISHTKMRKIR